MLNKIFVYIKANNAEIDKILYLKRFFNQFAAHFASATGAYTIVCDLAGAKATKK